MSHRSGARFGARELAVEIIGFSTVIRHQQPENHLQQLSRRFRDNFAREMRRLIGGVRMQRQRIAIVVYGLVNFESYFRGREIAERLRANDASRYPHLPTTYKYFRSFRPAYRAN